MRMITTGHGLAERVREARERAEAVVRLHWFTNDPLGECSVCKRRALWFTGSKYVPAFCVEHWTALQLSRRDL